MASGQAGIFVVAAALLLLAARPARADCESGIAMLGPLVARTAEPHLRALLLADMKRAEFELWEFDEVECALVLQHAERLLRSTN